MAIKVTHVLKDGRVLDDESFKGFLVTPESCPGVYAVIDGINRRRIEEYEKSRAKVIKKT